MNNGKAMGKEVAAFDPAPGPIPLFLPATADCVADIRDIVLRARASVVRHVNTVMPLAYWLIGRRIVVEEQRGKDRACYGERLLERISRELTATFGDGFGGRPISRRATPRTAARPGRRRTRSL